MNQAKAMGFTIFGLTGRNDDQKAATLGNLTKVGYDAFTSDKFYTKWTGVGASQQPSYVTCATAKCTTVEFKALTRKHIESLGYDVALNVGDQWSDLQGGYADRILKLPNPTYYLPSADLPGVSEPRLAPRTHFVMKADGSSGLTQPGDGIPNIDSVKSTIATYYGDTGTGLSNKSTSPYIREMASIVKRRSPAWRPSATSRPSAIRTPRSCSTPTTPPSGPTTWRSATCTSPSRPPSRTSGCRISASRQRRRWSR
nr:HAD family acid phosphatase [Frondihabitans sucicola]